MVAKQPSGLDFGSCSYENKRAGVQGNRKRHPEAQEMKTGGTLQAEARGLLKVLGQRNGELNCQGFGRLRPLLRQPHSTGGVWVTGGQPDRR